MADPLTAADGVGPLLGRLADFSKSGRPGPSERRRLMRELSLATADSARTAGAGAIASGRWLGDLVTQAVPYLPLRDAETLRQHHAGKSTEEMADALVRNASIATGGIGAAGGAFAAFSHLGPAAVVSVPVHLAVETALLALVEVKLVAELHEVYGAGVAGTPSQRAGAYLLSWSNRRGVDPLRPATAVTALGVGSRRMITWGLRRRGLKSMWSLVPLAAGAALGAAANHRETRRLAESIRVDLLQRRPLTGGWGGRMLHGLLGGQQPAAISAPPSIAGGVQPDPRYPSGGTTA